ncbi:MAG: flavodoxin domain-containing protein [Chitinophagaceae bacterium]|nr:flavodoxin domain-containing protein [Chitinophagaceae bacterium]
MLTAPKRKIIEELVASSSREELVWLSGYLDGMLANDLPAQPVSPKKQTPEPVAVTGSRKMTIVYGTETGNAKKLATDLATRAKKRSLPVKLVSLDQYRLTDITREDNLFVVISTQGDGEPPAAAKKFYDHIHHNGFRLDHLKYSVLALGDTSYPLFCKTGEDVDAQLQKLGGKCIIPVRKCDVDYEAEAESWFNEVLQAVEHSAGTAPAPAVQPAAEPVLKSNKKLYRAELLASINLHDKGAAKETYHIELAVAEAVDYLPGDSIGIVPENSDRAVQSVIDLTGIDPDKTVSHKGEQFSVRALLRRKLNISNLHERVVKKYAELVQQEIPETKMQLSDLLRIYPLRDAGQFDELLQLLPVQSPRIYTIASAPAMHADEIHLTVEKDVFTVNGKEFTGLCSDYLGSLQAGSGFEFFVQKNKRFKLPAPDKDILMIGPGTGIAAFRSFLYERDATGATGRNWLFFGEDHFVSDFLYQTEIQNWHATGLLGNISLAFSKDFPNIGVHHKLLEQGKEVFAWINSGAYLYVCGQKAPMSVEVENALLSIIERYGGFTAQETAAYFEKLKSTGHYSKDVY